MTTCPECSKRCIQYFLEDAPKDRHILVKRKVSHWDNRLGWQVVGEEWVEAHYGAQWGGEPQWHIWAGTPQTATTDSITPENFIAWAELPHDLPKSIEQILDDAEEELKTCQDGHRRAKLKCLLFIRHYGHVQGPVTAEEVRSRNAMAAAEFEELKAFWQGIGR